MSCWVYFLYIGVIDPNGGVNILWPLFGIANQMLAAIALCVATGILIKSGKLRFAWVTGAPLIWLVIITTTASYQKIFSEDVRVGFIASANNMQQQINEGLLYQDRIAILEKLILNLKIDTGITIFLVSILWIVLIDILSIALKNNKAKKVKEVVSE